MDQTISNDPVHAFAEPPLVDETVELLTASPLHIHRDFGAAA
jgi:hypothetical protein